MTLYTSGGTKHYLSFLDKFQVLLRAVGGRGRKSRQENRKQKKKELERGGKCSYLNYDILHHFFQNSFIVVKLNFSKVKFFFLLYNRFLLVMHFKYSSVYMTFAKYLIIPSSHGNQEFVF